jgi:mannobiose 2-epimerase
MRNGYLEAFDRDWNLLEDLRLSDKDANEKKTMNTHLHVLEAYTNLYRCWENESLQTQLKNLIVLFRDKIINEHHHFNLFFDEEWRLKSDVISFGHDIEGAWLLVEAARAIKDPVLIKDMEQKCLEIVDVTVREGLDADGGLMNEATPKEIFDTDKHWWPQAEAIVGLLCAWQISGKETYFDTSVKVWTFIKQNMIDKQNGEWYWRVSRDRTVCFDEDKAGPWKCPYHNGRAAFEAIMRLS